MDNFLAVQDTSLNPIPSSSPAFATPAHPIRLQNVAPVPAPQLKPTILPIQLPPQTLRPHAFRTLTNKYNLNFRPSTLVALANFIGRNCGSRWREDGLAEGVLEEVARTWKMLHGEKIVEDGEDMKSLLKSLESCMSGGRIMQGKSALSRQGSFALSTTSGSDGSSRRPGLYSESSFGMSSLEVDEEDEEASKDPRDWIRLVDAFSQPRLTYNAAKKAFEKNASRPSLLPGPSAKTELFRQRYHLVHQRILRNESFQPPSFSGASAKSNFNNRITAIANLLGRSGSSHLLLGLLTVLPTGQLALSDLTGAIALSLQHAQALPADASYFTPGMLILVDGVYEEEYGEAGATAIGGDGGVGGTLGGKFVASVIGHPPCERRSMTLGIPDADGLKLENGTAAMGPAFGWTDFLGLGSERAVGQRMRRLETRLLGPGAAHAGNGKIAIAAELQLDVPATLPALRTMLRSYAELEPAEYPMAIVLMGNFIAHAALSGAPASDSVYYKEAFNALAAVLAEFPELLSRTTLVMVPGDSDPWPSASSAGAAVPVPRRGVPQNFTNRITNAFKEANDQFGGKGKRKDGCVLWSSNPGRLTWFEGTAEVVLWRDDVLARLRRTAVHLKSKDIDADVEMDDTQQTQVAETEQVHATSDNAVDPDTQTARRLTKTLLDQAHLSPFPLSVRPVHWAYAHALHLYPLPTALVVADAEAPAFAVNYMGCCVMNPGQMVEGRKGEKARWVEYDVVRKKGVVRCEDSSPGR